MSLRVLSIMPKIPEISVGSQMERSVSDPSDRNIWEHFSKRCRISWSQLCNRNFRSILTNRFVALLLFTFVGNSENEQKMARTIPLGWPGWSDNVVSPLVSDRMVWHKAPNVSQMNTAKIKRTCNLVPRVSHLTALWGERGETLVWSGHVLL